MLVDACIDEQAKQLRVNVGIAAHGGHDAQRLAQRFGFLVGAVGRRQGFENIGDRHHSGRQAHFFAFQPFGITGAVHFFVVAAGDFRHVAQVPGEGQVAEHQDRLHHVMVDDVTLFSSQRASGNAQVVKLAPVVLVGRHVELEAPGIVLRYQLGLDAFEQMFGFVRQQRFAHWQCWRRGPCLAPVFFPGHAQAIVQGTGPGALGQTAQALQIVFGHRFAAEIAAGDEGKIIVQLGESRVAQFGQVLLVATLGDGLPVTDPGIALEDFETGADFVDAIVQGFQLGGLVDNVFGGGHFAAVM
ncbi:hypothetical protein D3C73_802410 [compost metagenome]